MTPKKNVASVYFADHPQRDVLEKLFRQIIKEVAQDGEVYRKLVTEKGNNKYDHFLLAAIREKYHAYTEEIGIRLSGVEERRFFKDVLDDIKGLGPIEQLLRDPEVTEIMVNGPFCIFVEKNGRNQLTSLRFIDQVHLLDSIQEIVGPVNRRINVSDPMIDARLADGSRINAVIEPVALDGPYLTIRKFPKHHHTTENLIKFGSISGDIAEFLNFAIQARLNILTSGGTGTGKTTMLNALSDLISPESRIVIVEDTAELTIHKGRRNVCRLEVRPANLEGKGEISIRQLIRNTLRMRPDRIVVGEVRGGEAFDLIQAMNTGHAGSLTTVHANSCWDVLHRLEAMVIMAGTNLTLDSIRNLISSGIDLIVHLGRFQDGSRKVVDVASVGAVGPDGKIKINPLWTYVPEPNEEQEHVSGNYIFAGIPQRIRSKMKYQGLKLPEKFLSKNEE